MFANGAKGGKGAKGGQGGRGGKGGKGFAGRGGAYGKGGSRYGTSGRGAGGSGFQGGKESDRIDAIFGFEKTDQSATTGVDRVGWLVNMRTVMVEQDETGKQLAGVEYYFITADGEGFKTVQLADAYFYISVQPGAEQEVEMSLRRKFPDQIKDVVSTVKEDLALPNHLAGLTKSYIKLVFRNTRDLMEVRKLVLPAVRKNKDKREAQSTYNGLEGDHDTANRASDSWLDQINDIREYDVPYHHRIAIDTGRRVGKWYLVRHDTGELCPYPEREAFGEPRVLAFDIECCKQPLKFPDASTDPVMMISYMVDGFGFLIINREVVSENIASFEYTPKPECPGPFTVFNEPNEAALLLKFCSHFREMKPHVVVTYNGDNFDWPYICERCSAHGINLQKETGFAKSTSDNGAYFVSPCVTHIDAIHWVKRDSYLPAGSHGLKAVCRAKLGYDPLEIDPEDMTRFAREQPQLMSSYSVSDAVATYYLYMKYVHGFIFSLATIIPMSPDEVLRKGSGTLCESLLMVEAYNANVICPNKQVEDQTASFDGHLLESETYVGGHVECLQTGIYRSDLPIKFRLVPAALQGLIDRLDDTLRYAIEHEGGVELSEVTNYDEVRGEIEAALCALRDAPDRTEEPVIYHLDVGAMYPNIILTNRLQPPAIVSEQTCAACVHNKPESNCKRPLQWMWRGEIFPASRAESEVVRTQIEHEPVPSFDGQAPRSFFELEPAEQNARFRARLKEYCNKVYKKNHITKMELRTATTCQRENPFYIDTVRAFRDRRYEYKKLNKTWGKKKGDAEKEGNTSALMQAKAMCVLYDSLQLAHKCILNSFYGYVMRRGARWFSMEMAGIVTYTGANIIKEARVLVEQIGKTLELDTDGIWCVFPKCFPQDFTFRTSNPSKAKLPISYPCIMLNVDVDKTCNNSQYQRQNENGEFTTQREMSIYFEVDGPYKAMILPASTEEGKLLKKRYAVFEHDGSLAELKGFEVKRRGELKLIKVFQTQVFEGGCFLKGSSLAECYDAVAQVANKWLDVLDTRGEDLEDEELLELVSEQKSMSRSLEEYGTQKSTAITVAKRLAEFLGDQMVKDAGLACKYIIANKPADAAVTDRAIPVTIFDAEEPVKVHFIRRWLKDRTLSAEEASDIRAIIDWSYYRQRLENAIQKIITIPAACQKVSNPVPRVKHPDWLHTIVRQHDDTYKQKSLKDMMNKATDKQPKVVDIEDQFAVKGVAKKAVVHKRKASLASRRAGADIVGDEGGIPDNDCLVDGMETENKPGDGAQEKLEEGPTDDKDVQAQADTDGAEAPSIGSVTWLAQRKSKWRAMRQERKRHRDEESRDPMGIPAPAQRKKPSGRGGVGSFYADSAVTLHSSHWQLLTIQETSIPGELTAWVLLGESIMHAIPLRVPRTIYVNMKEPVEKPGWEKVSRSLPHGASPLCLYEITMSESDFITTGDMSYWLQDKNVDAVYHTQYSPLLRTAVQLGSCCHVVRGAPRRQTHDGFDLGELKQSATNGMYLRASDGNPAGPCNIISIYASGTATRGVLGLFAPQLNVGMLVLIRPRGSATSEQSKSAMHSHEAVAQRNMEISFDAFDTWDAALGRLQRLLPGLQRQAKGSTIALVQTEQALVQMQHMVPALKLLPAIAVPYCRTDGSWDEPIQLGGAWQPKAVTLALDRLSEQRAWWEQRLSLARYANIPVGLLSCDGHAFAMDVLLQRRLLQTGHLSWLSTSPKPDFGGHFPGDNGINEELKNPELCAPGMYRTVCVELQVTGLAVNTVLESSHVHVLDGIDIGKEMVHAGTLADAAHGQSMALADDATMCASAFRLVKLMLKGWMKDVLERNDECADALLLNMHRWISSPASLLHDPALQRMLLLMMKKVWMQLLAELRALGAKVVFSNFSSVIIATDKMGLKQGHDYVQFLLSSLLQKPIFAFLSIKPLRYWSSLLYMDPANFGGICHVSQDEIYDEESGPSLGDYDVDSARVVGCWDMAHHLPPAIQQRFRTLIDLWVGEAWTRAANQAKEEQLPAPKSSQVATSATEFFENMFSMKVLETVGDIRSTLGSSGAVERDALLGGSATQAEVNRTFPRLVGSHLEMQSPALEFSKMLCHLISLEAHLLPQLSRLRRNLFKLLNVREFASEAQFVSPSLHYVLPDVACEFCGHCRDLDFYRNPEWSCECCDVPYDKDAIEYRLVQIVQKRCLSYQAQDLSCSKCGQVKRSHLSSRCERCAGPFLLRPAQQKLTSKGKEGLVVFMNLAHFYEMPWLTEVLTWINPVS
ncbi:hypothetical protein AB1Y20_009223 [Prymnesium parvum]|uniref:DNA polymerase epsilon catalytic subunit n=1 Tax=Prymnesium parvum TaxID=97485 RepID=A0AB34K600_PRYPA